MTTTKDDFSIPNQRQLPLRALSAMQAVSQELKRRLGNQWRVGDRLPPVKDLARQLGTGQSNTHEAVKQLVKQGLLDSRQRRGTFVVRLPSQEARTPTATLPDLRGRTIALFNAPAPEGMVQRMIDSFTAELEPTDVSFRRLLITSSLEPTISIEDADVVVQFNPGSNSPVRCLPHQSMLVITTAPHAAIVLPPRYDIVSVDEHHGGALAGQVLRRIDCDRVCFVGRGLGPEMTRYDGTSAARLYGFESAWGEPVHGDDLFYAVGYSPLSGGKMFRKYIAGKNPPQGVFAASDDLAIGFVAAAVSHGLTPGKDFHIVGFDGQDRGQMLGERSLTTVKVPAADMGRRGASFLLQRIADPNRPPYRLQMECNLHLGTTTGTPNEDN